MLIVANKPIMLSVVMLSVIAPTQEGQDSGITLKILDLAEMARARQKITIM